MVVRRIVGFAAFTFVTACAVVACKGSDGAAAGDGGAAAEAGGKPKKLTCKMEGQCWLCPDEAAIKKCIINPVTSGCTKASDSDCR
jgi:hypothetical protein